MEKKCYIYCLILLRFFLDTNEKFIKIITTKGLFRMYVLSDKEE